MRVRDSLRGSIISLLLFKVNERLQMRYKFESVNVDFLILFGK